MLEGILQLFTTEQKVQAMLEAPIIRLIFILLFVGFLVSFVVHIVLYLQMKRLNQYVKSTGRLDIEPLLTMQKKYATQDDHDLSVETFIQEQFSNWRLFNIPVVSLMKMIRATISIFILLGVLGTFIGLTISLGAIQVEGDELVEHIVGVLSGIDVAFYTSIVGMSCSLLMTVGTHVLNTEHLLTDLMLSVESTLEQQGERGMSELVNTSQSIYKEITDLRETNERSMGEVVNAFTGFKDYTAGLQQSAKDLALFNEGLTANLKHFQTIFNAMEKQTNEFQVGTDRLNENFTTIINYFQSADERHEYIAKRLERTFDHVEVAVENQRETTGEISEIVKDLQSYTSDSLDEQKQVANHLTTVNHSMEGLTNEMNRHNEQFKRLFGNQVSDRLERIGKYINHLAGRFDTLDETIVHLPEALHLIADAYNDHRDLVLDRFQEIKHFNETFHEHLRQHQRESAAFDQQINKATTTFETMGRENEQLIQSIHRITADMQRDFQDRDHQVEGSLQQMQQTLSDYINRLEQSLGSQLQQVQEQMNQTTNQRLNQLISEFANLRQLHEQLLQEQTRAIQQLMQTWSGDMQGYHQNLQTVEQRLVNTLPNPPVRHYDE